MIHKTMMDRVVVNVDYHLSQIVFVFNLLSPERSLEQAAMPIIPFVDVFGVGVEQMGEVVGGIGLFSTVNAVGSACGGRRRVNDRFPFNVVKPDGVRHSGPVRV